STVSEADSSIQQRIILARPDSPSLLSLNKDDVESLSKQSRNLKLVKEAESVISGWCQQIRVFLAEAAQLRREGDDVGPDAELEYWRGRMTKFTNLTEQFKDIPYVKGVVAFLQLAGSSIIEDWKVVTGEVFAGATEAYDNIKYLKTLERALEPLYRSDPVQMVES
ncbi:Dynein heavy chain like protein, partial [Aduncisulcus paluster]